MKCLCCGKEIRDSQKKIQGWHATCVRSFFGTKDMPEIDLSGKGLETLAMSSISQGFTVPGVQKKLSLHLSREDRPRLTLVNYPSGYILKPQEKQYAHMPEAEHLIMSMAEVAGIMTVPHALIQTEEDIAYITRRVDRVVTEQGQMHKLAMEDFCQLDKKPTEEKYHGSYERCARIIERYSSRIGFDRSEYFLRLVFCFLTGNSDMHLKNFALIETKFNSREYALSPAYDLLPVQLILPEDEEDMALTLNGKKTHIRRKDFLLLAQNIGVPDKAARMEIEKMLDMIPSWEEMCKESMLPDEMQRGMIDLLHERAGRIEKTV